MQIRPIFADQVTAVSHNKSFSKEDRQEKIRAIRSATTEKIEPLLTPDQMEKWGEWKQRNWDRAANRRQDTGDRDKWRTHRRGNQEAQWQARFEQFTRTLSLTEDQQEKIRPLFADQAEQINAVFNDKSLSPEDRQERVKTIHSVTEEKIEPFLSPDQMEKWGKWKQNGWDRAEERSEQNSAPSPDHDQKTDSDNK